MKKLKNLLLFAACVFLTSLGYFLAIYPNRPEDPEHETFLAKIGEVFGTLGIWALVIIYGRTVVKLVFWSGWPRSATRPGRV